MRTTEVNKWNFHKHQRGAPGPYHWQGGQHQWKYTNTQMYKCTNTQIRKCTNAQIHKYKNVQMHKYTNAKMNVFTNIKAESARLHTIDKIGLWAQNFISNWASTYKVVQRILHLKTILNLEFGLMKCSICDLGQWGIKLTKTTWQNYLIDWLILEVLGQHGRPLT